MTRFKSVKDIFAALKNQPTEEELAEIRQMTNSVTGYVDDPEEQRRRFFDRYQWLPQQSQPQGRTDMGKELSVDDFYNDVHRVLTEHGWMPPKPLEGVFAVRMERIDYMALFVETGDIRPVLGTVNTFYVSKRWAHLMDLMQRSFPGNHNLGIDIPAAMGVSRIVVQTIEPMVVQGFPAEPNRLKFDIGLPWGTGHKLTNMAGNPSVISWDRPGATPEPKRNNTPHKKRIERG
jgi:hypothetical protein